MKAQDKKATEEKALAEQSSKTPLSQQITGRLIGKLKELQPDIVVTEQMRRLMTNYFIGINQMLEMAEKKRLERGDNRSAPYTWNNIDMADLAIGIIDKARLGLDILLPNHVHAIPYWNTTKEKYTVNLMPGYNGIKNMAMAYAQDPPQAAIVELVHETDYFIPIKRDHRSDHDTYEFEIREPFSRGEVIGGFGYLMFDDPSKNRLILMSNEEIEKRKPDKASANFWGKWNTEMKHKTLVREVFSAKNVPLDSTKLDDAYARQAIKEAEMNALLGDIESTRTIVQAEIAENANQRFIDITPSSPPAAPVRALNKPEGKQQPVEQDAPKTSDQEAENAAWAAAFDDMPDEPSF